jgi:hypothetical protein
MDPGFLAEMMGVTRGFFNLPLDEKQKYSNLANGKEFRNEGYGNDMVLSEDQVLDWCDRLYLIVEPESRIVRSLWPAQPPAFSDVLREYTARCREVTGVVLASVARLLGLHEGRFVGMMDEGVAMTHARFNYYPRCPEPDRVFGLKPHSIRRLRDHRRPHRRRRQRAPGAETQRRQRRLVRRAHRSQSFARQHRRRNRGRYLQLQLTGCNRVLDLTTEPGGHSVVKIVADYEQCTGR